MLVFVLKPMDLDIGSVVFDLKFGVNETCPKYKTLEMAQLEISNGA